jgi:hypothetical protein
MFQIVNADDVEAVEPQEYRTTKNDCELLWEMEVQTVEA